MQGEEALSTVLLRQSPPSPGWPAPPPSTLHGWCDFGISWQASDVAFAVDRNKDPSEAMTEPFTPSLQGKRKLGPETKTMLSL